MRYHGGKWRLADWIISHMPPHRVYVEAYGGAASVLMQKPRTYAEVYNDLDKTIVTVFRVLQDDEKRRKLCRKLECTPFSRQEFERSYQPTDEPVESARRTLIRCFQGHAGRMGEGQRTGFRAHSYRRGSSHAHSWSRYPAQIEAFGRRLEGVVIECRDALEVIQQQDTPRTLHYLDPPYVSESRETIDAYDCEMTDSDYEDLATVLSEVQGMVLLSGYRCNTMTRLFGDWHRVDRNTQANGQEGGVDRQESLWMNQAVLERSQSLFNH